MIPPFQQYLYPFLKLMGDGKIRNISDIRSELATLMKLSEEELAETLEKSGQYRHHDRCSWAKTYLLKAGLITCPQRAHFVVTEEGKKLLASGITYISNKFLLEHYPSFAEFVNHKKDSSEAEPSKVEDTTPTDRMIAAHEELTANLVDEICAIVEILPNVEALVHVSQLDLNRVENPAAIARIGEEMLVKVIEIAGDRIRASRKAVLLEEQGHEWSPEDTSRRPRQTQGRQGAPRQGEGRSQHGNRQEGRRQPRQPGRDPENPNT